MVLLSATTAYAQGEELVSRAETAALPAWPDTPDEASVVMTEARAVELALQHAPRLAEASAQRAAAEAQVSVARAALLPRLDLTARYTRIDGFEDGAIGSGPDPAAISAAQDLAATLSDPAARSLWQASLADQAQSGFAFTQPRDRFAFGARLSFPASDALLALLPALEGSESQVRAADARQEAAATEVRYRAREAFYRLAEALGQRAVARQAVVQAAEQRAQTRAAVRAGLGEPADGLAVDAQLSRAQTALAQAQSAVAVAEVGLRVQLGLPPGRRLWIPQSALSPPPRPRGSPAQLTARALRTRPDIAALRHVLDAQRAAGRASDAQAYPHLSVYAAADLANPNPYVIPPEAAFQPSFEVGALLSWSPNDVLTTYHRGEEQAANQGLTAAQIRTLEDGVRLEVERAMAELSTARAARQAASAAAFAAEGAYRSRRAQVEAGTSTTAALLQAERQLNEARLDELRALVQLRLAQARLERAIGV